VQHNLEQQEYELSWQNSPVVDGVEPSWHAPNRAQGFRTYFTQEGIRVVPRESTALSWRWGLSLVGYGNGEKTWDVPGASLAASGRRMAYRRGAFEESYLNTPEGLEQGFILPAPPGSSGAGGIPPESRAWRTPLRKASTENQHASGAERALVGSAGFVHVDLALWGDLSPRVSEDGQAIDFVTPAGAPALHYAQLKVTDARGSVLHSWMEGFAGEGVRGIRLVLDAKEAVYPITIDPLSTGWAWTAQTSQGSAYLGNSVATAGDVNGDGFSDVIISAPYFDNGQADEGRAYVYLGSASILGSIAAWTAEGDLGSASFGASVATAGDVNGDGYSDVIVGASGYTNGQTNEGRAYLYLVGHSVGTAGDVNGDGYADVIVGAPDYNAGQSREGRAYVYLGSASGPAPSPVWVADGELTDARFGASVATAGDMNGDGFADIIIGAPGFAHVGPNDGRVSVYLGGPSGLGLFSAWTRSNQAGASFGASVATAGDVNGDGYADILIGATGYDDTFADEGRAFVYYGNGGGLSVRPQQRRSDGSAPIAPLGRSNAPDFRLAALARTPFGRGRVKLEWEVKPLGTPFNGLGTQQSAAPIDTGTDGTGIDELVTGLGPGVHHWRIRFRYGTAATPFAQSSRWFTVPWNGWQEADLRSGAFVGGFAWDDLDLDGVRDAGEPGHAGVLVSLYSGGSTIVAEKTTLADGTYNIDVPGAGPYQLLFTSPSGYTYTIPKQGGDDLLDSDVDPSIGLTVPIGPAFTAADASRWSAGLISCPGPTLPISIVGARMAPGTTNVILDFTDPNPPGTTTGATGYNSYRSSQPQPPPAPWMAIAGDTVDEDPGTPNIQLTDWTGDFLAVGSVFYYQVQAYNHVCGTEGPR